MTEKRIVDNSERPAQPEPGEDAAAQIPSVREEGRSIAPHEQQQSEREERERQTGE